MVPQNSRRDPEPVLSCICAMSWQPLDVKLSAPATERGEGPTAVGHACHYGLAVAETICRSSSAISRKCSSRDFEAGDEDAWRTDKGGSQGPAPTNSRIWKVLMSPEALP